MLFTARSARGLGPADMLLDLVELIFKFFLPFTQLKRLSTNGDRDASVFRFHLTTTNFNKNAFTYLLLETLEFFQSHVLDNGFEVLLM